MYRSTVISLMVVSCFAASGITYAYMSSSHAPVETMKSMAIISMLASTVFLLGCFIMSQCNDVINIHRLLVIISSFCLFLSVVFCIIGLDPTPQYKDKTHGVFGYCVIWSIISVSCAVSSALIHDDEQQQRKNKLN